MTFGTFACQYARKPILKIDSCGVLMETQKQVTTTSGVVGALGVSVSASGLSKEQTPESANGSESLKAERETWLSGEPPPALFELASGLFQGRRQDDAGESSPRGSVDSVDSADCAAPGMPALLSLNISFCS